MASRIKYLAKVTMEETGALARVFQACAIGLPALCGTISEIFDISIVIPSLWWWLFAAFALFVCLLFNVITRAQRLDADRKPRLRFQLDRASRAAGTPILFRLRIMNESSLTIRRVIVNLERADGVTCGNLPARLQLGAITTDNIDLNPRQLEYVNICRLEGDTESDADLRQNRLSFCFHNSGIIAEAALGTYTLLIRAYGDNAPPTEIETRITAEKRQLSYYTNIEVLRINGKEATPEDFRN